MHEPQQRASNLRVSTLASAVALAVVLPLAAATAGTKPPDTAGERSAASLRSPSTPSPPSPLPPSPSSSLSLSPELLSDVGLAEVTAVCGPQATAPEGVRAQTCVLSRNRTTWGRMYYRNTTGESLHGALSLMGPDGRAVHMPCALPAVDRPGACDTPHQRTAKTRPGQEPYAAVAEIGTPDGEGLLLRSGSNTGDVRGADGP